MKPSRNKHPARPIPPPDAVTNWAFFLDIDGTLLALAENPSEVKPDSHVGLILRQLHDATHGALALISGRPIAEIDRLFAPLILPTAGQHGMERRDRAGHVHRHVQHSQSLTEIKLKLEPLAARHPALVLEDKGLTVALHYRQAPRLGPYVHRQVREWLNGVDDLCVQRGKMVLEIKPGGSDKGSAITEFMSEAPFQGRIPVFLGDDVSDEYGFSVINELGGHSIKVGTGVTAARWRLAGVGDVRAWLERCVRILSQAAHSDTIAD